MTTAATLGSADANASRTGVDRQVGNVSTLEWVALAGILLVATAARFYRLDTSLWYDEIDTLLNFVQLPTRELIHSLRSNNHMFYSLQAQASIALFSESAWSLRLPAVLFGLASLVAIWALARCATGRVEALVVAFLLAISYHHVWFSQDARGYTELLFWTTWAMLLFARGLAGSGWRTWTLYAISMTAASYTHLSALFFFLGHGIVYLAALALLRVRPGYFRRHPALAGAPGWKPLFGFALGTALTIALYAPLLSQVLNLIHSMTVDPTNGPGEWRHPWRTVQEVAATLSGAGPLVPFVLGAAVIALASGVIFLARKQPVITAAYLLHIPLVMLVLATLNSRIWPRFFLVDIGFIYLAVVHGTFVLCRYAARGLGSEGGTVLRARIFTATAVVVMTGGSLWMLARNYAYPKQDFAGAAAYVERERRPDDAVTSLPVGHLGFRLYAPQWSVVNSVAELNALRQSAPRTWVVVAFQRPGPPGPIGEAVAENFDAVKRLPGTLFNGDIVIYRSRPR
jgi:heme/copper-type cytochrome/quinol oxidase subunit 4